MYCRIRARSIAAALVVAAGCGWASGTVGALPVIGETAVIAQLAAHNPKEWHWQGEWSRHGPWADHVIQGIVITRPRVSPFFAPWGAHRQLRCATRYRGYDPVTGTYLTRRGKRRMCR